MSRDVLRVATVGSVDDGKSTLIGRLLVDSRQLFDDQLDAVADASERRGVGDLDLSFVTDGLRAEREQGITIDVAYRYATTPTRKYVIADCPGHVRYTRNMATGASTADVALVVLDVTGGVKEQTRRHLCITALLGVRDVIVAINKMDQVNWDEERFGVVARDIGALAAELGFTEVRAVPISALSGENVVAPSAVTPWYDGPCVLEALEATTAGRWARTETGSRLPIQWVLRQEGGGRTYAGLVDGQSLRVGDSVTLLPSGTTTTIRGLRIGGRELREAEVGLAADVDLADDTDASRGDVLATGSPPRVTTQFDATLCWFGETPLRNAQRLRLKHTTKSTPARVDVITGRVDIESLSVVPSDQLELNDIGLVSVHCADPVVIEEYGDNRVMGSFILIDEVTNVTVAAGMVGHATFLRGVN